MRITIGEFIAENTRRLKEHGLDSPKAEVIYCICEICGIDGVEILIHSDRILDKKQRIQLDQALQRRVQGESMAYILGYKYFYRYKFNVDSRVLVPRPETELIVEKILEWVKDQSYPYKILDMGTGSGCIGLSLIKELRQAHLMAVDISHDTLNVFRENARNLQVLDRVKTLRCDLTHPLSELVMVKSKEFTGREVAKRPLPHRPRKGSSTEVLFFENLYDIIVANPPYIALGDTEVCPNVVRYEPHVALFTEGGTRAPLAWMEGASHLMAPQESVFMMEFGLGQGSLLMKRAKELDLFDNVELISDYTHRERFIYGVSDKVKKVG